MAKDHSNELPASAHPAAAGHAEPNYMGVFAVLFILTVAEVGVVYLTFLPKLAIAGSLVVMAFAKAICVAAYFMHLKFERKTLALIAATPIVLCVFLAISLMPDAK